MHRKKDVWWILVLGSIVSLASAAGGYEDGPVAAGFDRRTFYTQPMGYSIWKPPPGSVEEFVQLLEGRKLNATPEQYARSLHDAGWIETAEAGTALVYLRGLQSKPIAKTEAMRLGRLLRPYRSDESILDGNFIQVVKAGEQGYFNGSGELVIRVRCLNVVYPERRAAAALAPAPIDDAAAAPPALPAEAPPPVEQVEEPPQPLYRPPAPFKPFAREAQEPASPSAP